MTIGINIPEKKKGGLGGLIGKIAGGVLGAIGGTFAGNPVAGAIAGSSAGAAIGGTVGEAADPEVIEQISPLQTAAKERPEIQISRLEDAISATARETSIPGGEAEALMNDLKRAKEAAQSRLKMGGIG